MYVERALMELRRPESEGLAGLLDHAWTLAEAVAMTPDDEIADRAYDIIEESGIELSLRFEIFVRAWALILASEPPKLRGLVIPFTSLEQDELNAGGTEWRKRAKRSCLYLEEVLDDDLDWTGFVLPGEPDIEE